MTDDELRAEVDAFLAEGGRGEFEEREVPNLTRYVASFKGPMLILNASGIASGSVLYCDVENAFGHAAATTWSTGAISGAIRANSSVQESARHTA